MAKTYGVLEFAVATGFSRRLPNPVSSLSKSRPCPLAGLVEVAERVESVTVCSTDMNVTAPCETHKGDVIADKGPVRCKGYP